jgi:hypothetical protein
MESFMSAFLCSDRHIYNIAAWAKFLGLVTDAAKTAAELRALNNYALKCRYGDAPVGLKRVKAGITSASKELNHRALASDPVQTDRYVYALTRCLNYQCSEGDTEKQPEWAVLQTILDALDLRTGHQMLAGIWRI